MHLRGCLCRPRYHVNEGAILEAGAIVLKDVNPWMIVIENTARD
jgi:acetyltransferase-like isoleucine patch superfamily enzyme